VIKQAVVIESGQLAGQGASSIVSERRGRGGQKKYQAQAEEAVVATLGLVLDSGGVNATKEEEMAAAG
jgi:hypothetical protein